MDIPHSDRLIGRQILRYDSVTSTNDIARELIRNQADEGTVVVAAEQSLGRGSRARKWISPSGANLLMSVILRPDVPTQRMSELAFVASMAIADYLVSIGLAAQLKWPNDVRVSGKKIAGILIEVVQGQQPAAIVGIGLNVNWADLPVEIAETASSILIETGRPTELNDALDGVISSLDTVYRDYCELGFQPILSRWKPMDCLAGTEVAVSCDGEAIRGVSEGVDSNGALLLRMPDGNLKSVQSASLLLE